MLLTDLPWLWCANSVPADAPAGPVHHAVGPDAEALADGVSNLVAGDLAVVVPPGVQPWPGTPGHSVAPEVFRGVAAGDSALLWPALDAVTATIAPDRGLWLLSRDAATAALRAIVDGTAARLLRPVVPPLISATWDGAATPEAAFRLGHAAMDAPRDARLALLAALGADHPNGDWWGIGAARALLGDEVDAAWTDEASQPEAGLSARRAELSRRVRVRCGLAVHPLSPPAAAALRAMRSPVAPPEVWDRHAADLAAILPDGATDPTVTGVRLARGLVWGVA